MAFRNPILAGTTLIRSAIQSNNYLAGHTGWQIATSGHAEFNDITIRGASAVGGTSLYYSGTPAAGNLIASIAATAGTDAYGNAYPAGAATYDPYGRTTVLQDGTLFLGTHGAVKPGDAYIINLSPSPFNGLQLHSGANATGETNGCDIILYPGDPGVPTSASNAAQVQVLDQSRTGAADVLISGNIYGSDGQGNLQDWTAATLSGVVGDTSAGMLGGLFTRRLGVAGLIGITGNVHTTGTVANGTVIATGLPPTASARAMVPCTNNVGGGGGPWSSCMLFVDNAGRATYYGANLSSGAQIYLTGIYPAVGV